MRSGAGEEPSSATPQSVELTNLDLDPFPSDWSNNNKEGCEGVLEYVCINQDTQPDIMSLLSTLIGSQTQTLILTAHWVKITITGLWRGAKQLTALQGTKSIFPIQNKMRDCLIHSLHTVTVTKYRNNSQK